MTKRRSTQTYHALRADTRIECDAARTRARNCPEANLLTRLAFRKG